MPVLGRGGHDIKERPARRISHARLLLAKYTRPNSLRGRCVERLRSTSRMYSLFTISNIRVPLLFKADANLNDTGQKQQNHPHPTKAKPSRRNWWSLTGSNRRPPECKSGALPAELRPQTGSSPDRQIMVGLGRLERPTSPLSGVRSNHLSYRPKTSTKTQRRP